MSSRLDRLNAVRLKNDLRHRLFARIMESRATGKKELHTGEMLNRMVMVATEFFATPEKEEAPEEQKSTSKKAKK